MKIDKLKLKKNMKYFYPYYDVKTKVILHRNYGSIFINEIKYDRNIGFKKHDNSYGIKSIGTKEHRRFADKKLYIFLKSKNDPLAFLIYILCITFGRFYYTFK